MDKKTPNLQIENRRWHVARQIAVAALILVACGVNAYGAGTQKDVVITNSATITATNALAEATASVALTVTGVYGLATSTFIDPADAEATSGNYRDYAFSVQNNGNATDSLRLNVGAFAFGAGAGTQGNWAMGVDVTTPLFDGDELIWNTSGATSANPAGDQAEISLTPGAAATFTVRVYVASDAADDATMTAAISFETRNTPVGSYTGYNGLAYGGAVTIDRAAGTMTGATLLTTRVSGVVLALSKSRAVSAPAQYIANGGGATDAVPGAKITYTINYSNTGALQAEGVVISDNVADNTTYVENSIILDGVAQLDPDDAVDDCYNPGSAPEDKNTVTCEVGSVAGSGSGAVTYEVTID